MISHSFEKVIAKICDTELAVLLQSYKYTVYGGHTVVVEGHKGLLKYLTSCVTFRLQKGTLSINGDALTIRNLSQNTAVVMGNKVSVEVKQ